MSSMATRENIEQGSKIASNGRNTQSYRQILTQCLELSNKHLTKVRDTT